MNETMTQLYRRGLTVVSTRRGYGLYFTKGDTLQFLELQADNDHCADQLLQAAREKTGAANARILLAENQTLYLAQPPLRLRNDRLFRPPLLRDRCVFQDAAVRDGPTGKPRKACTVGAGHFGKGCGPHMRPLQTAALIGCKKAMNL